MSKDSSRPSYTILIRLCVLWGARTTCITVLTDRASDASESRGAVTREAVDAIDARPVHAIVVDAFVNI